jgi:alkylhydroperoxidase family enzyme
MSHLERLKWGEVDRRLQTIFEKFYEERGNVPNLFRVMGHRAELMSSFNGHFGKVMGDGTLSIALKEMVAVRVSQINECEY